MIIVTLILIANIYVLSSLLMTALKSPVVISIIDVLIFIVVVINSLLQTTRLCAINNLLLLLYDITSFACRTEQFDIQNELIVGRYYEERFQNPDMSKTFFVKARAEDSDMDLYLNDFTCITSGANTEVNELRPLVASLLERRGCVKVEVAVLGCPSLKSLMVSVDVKQH